MATQGAHSATPDLIDTAEAAREMNRSPETLQRWRRLRSGPSFVRINGRVLYSRLLLREWVETKLVAGGAA
jgi:hypothetical protein